MMIGESPAIQSLIAKVPAVAKAKRTTLITGPTGSGKEVLAHLLHEKGCSSQSPFVPLNCSAVPEELIESELFGHVKGAFTGAGTRKGLIQSANNGVLFLDEINSANMKLQTKLLRFLESKEYRAVGSDTPEVADKVWVLAATNSDLNIDVEKGRFREDLMYRLNVISLDIPPLRERMSDVAILANHFIETLAGQDHYLSDEALEKLETYHWPGNVRELKHCLETAIIFSESFKIDASNITLPKKASAQTYVNESETIVDLWQLVEKKGLSLAEAMVICEEKLICAALRAEGNNRSRAAQRLRIHNRTIFKKLTNIPSIKKQQH